MNILRTSAAVVLITIATACSGGDKIVSPDALNTNNNNTGAKKLSTDDSSYVIGQIAGAAFNSINTLRHITTSPLPTPAAGCNPTVSSNADIDSNGVPDDKLVTYTAANCSYNSNGTAVVITGSIRLQDIGGIYGYRITYNNYLVVGKKGDSTVTASANGVAEYAVKSATQATTQDGLTISASAAASTGSSTLTRTGSLSGTFTPSGANVLVRFGAIPTGTLILSGTINIVAAATGNQIPSGGPSSQTLTMLISTATPLNASIVCPDSGPINLGELQATVGGSQTGAAGIKFTACGQGGSAPTSPSGGGKK